jgi:hypothetical protein
VVGVVASTRAVVYNKTFDFERVRAKHRRSRVGLTRTSLRGGENWPGVPGPAIYEEWRFLGRRCQRSDRQVKFNHRFRLPIREKRGEFPVGWSTIMDSYERSIPACCISTLLVLFGFFACGKLVLAADSSVSSTTAPSSSASPSEGTCSANNINDIEYLNFWSPLPGTKPDLSGIRALAARLGTTGDGKTRQLAHGGGIPIFASDASIVHEIRLRFGIARQTNVAVHFNVDDHIGWDGRPDLWNWYDPKKPGYSPANRKNVEWYDWEGTPNKRRYLTPDGTPSQTPHMCYNSPKIQAEISRIISQVVGPTLMGEINTLKQNGQEYLFAGITVGAEAGFDDYSIVAKLLPQLPRHGDPVQMDIARMIRQAATLMDEDQAPYSRLGYCSLTNAGYSKTNPPTDFNRALTEVNQKFIEYWDKQFVDAGISCSRIYTHVATASLQDDNNNAPIRIVFNPYARPGWTTYPGGLLANGFGPLYDELAKHGNPAWGGVEANVPAFAIPNAPSWEKYLAWHYNHGAKLVGINVGAADPSIMSNLSKSAFGDEAIAAYEKFLNGEKLIEK